MYYDSESTIEMFTVAEEKVGWVDLYEHVALVNALRDGANDLEMPELVRLYEQASGDQV